MDASKLYALGHSAKELLRLKQQGALFEAETEQVLVRAGIARGMRVLDIGCGVGDVSLIAARLVGAEGTVVGVDSSREAIDVAQDRGRLAGYDWLTFENTDLNRLNHGAEYDALVGRFILLHLADPAEVLSELRRYIRFGAIVAFLELDIDRAEAVPEMPLLSQVLLWITETYRRDGIDPNMGSNLYSTFRRAGLSPRMAGSCRIEGPPGSEVFGFAADTVRSLMPRILALGVATAEEIDINTLATRLSEQAIAGDHCVFLPRLVGAWARFQD